MSSILEFPTRGGWCSVDVIHTEISYEGRGVGCRCHPYGVSG